MCSSDLHCEEREHREDGLRALAHEAHIAVGDEGDDGNAQEQVLFGLVLHEIAREAGGGHDQHDDVLDDGHAGAGPEGVGRRLGERQVALEHVHRILLEREDGGVVQHAQQGDEPESAVGQDLADVADLERIVLLLGLAGLGVQFLVQLTQSLANLKLNMKLIHLFVLSVVHVRLTAQLVQ